MVIVISVEIAIKILPPHITNCWSSGMYSDKLLFVRNLIFFTPAAGNQPFMIFHAAKINSNTC